jgi:high affinity choline transporter 7
MWSVGYADTVQFALIPIGLFLALPFALGSVGGFDACWAYYIDHKREAALLLPPLTAQGYWTAPKIVGWWDLTFMLVLGGIPWNCYFQRVQSCQTPAKAQWHSIVAGLITIGMTIPPLVLGLAAFSYDHWSGAASEELRRTPAMALPLLLQQATPAVIAIVGLAAIVGAVTSSFSASILSAGSMISWNIFRGLIAPGASAASMRRMIRVSILVLGAVAAMLALRVQSVQRLWFLTSDLVFVLLFPQLLFALFDRRANRTGSMVAFFASLILRLGGGEPVFGLPATIPYAEVFAAVLPGESELWFDAAEHGTLFPVRTLAALAGLVLLPVVSRLTASWDPPRPLPEPAE